MEEPSEEDFYSVLEIPRNATAAQIKRAYHRLALKYHPDKTGIKDSLRFQAISQAYRVLSNNRTRYVYDRYGEPGLYLLSNVRSTAVVDLILDGRRLRLLLFCLWLLILSVCLLPILIGLRASLDKRWPWCLLFLPLWLLDIVIVVFGVGLMYVAWGSAYEESAHTTSEDGGNMADGTSEARMAFGISVTALILVVGAFASQQIILALKLDGVTTIPWISVLLPLIIFQNLVLLWRILRTIYVLRNWHVRYDEAAFGFGLEKDDFFSRLHFVFLMLRTTIANLLFLLLISQKAQYEDESIISWTVVFLPIYILHVLSMPIDYLYDRRRERLIELAATTLDPLKESSDTENKYSHNSFPGKNETSSKKTLMRAKYFFYTILTASTLVTFLMINIRLGWNPPIISWGLAMTPVFILGSLIILAVILGGIFAIIVIPTLASTPTSNGAGHGFQNNFTNPSDSTNKSDQPISRSASVSQEELNITLPMMQWMCNPGFVFGPPIHRVFDR